MRQWLWRDVTDCIGQYASPHVYWLPVASVAAIFAVCAALDYIRIHTVEKWTFGWLDNTLFSDRK